MNVLIITTKYSLNPDSPWLTNELSESLRDRGNDVTVLVVDWQGKEDLRGITTVNGIKVLCISSVTFPMLPSTTINLILKWIFSSLNAYLHFKSVFKNVRFDVLITFSPCAALWYLIIKLRKHINLMMLVYWDFFPIHNFQIGKVPYKFLLNPLYFLEKYLVSMFNFVGLMSKKNINFFKGYFPHTSKQNVFELPIWGRKISMVNRGIDNLVLKIKEKYQCVAVFGGQLEFGRGIEDLLFIAKLLRKQNSDIGLLIIGDGPLKEKVVEASSDGLHNLIYYNRLSRQDYLRVLSACDIGIVATQANVTIPSYPSKSIDYFLCELPIIASVEKTTDFGEIIENAGCGFFCPAGDNEQFMEKLELLSMNPDLCRKLGKSGRVFFDKRHDIEVITSMILNKLKSS
jgi:glycosyltransferase involved in cell wall biosynthesis